MNHKDEQLRQQVSREFTRSVSLKVLLLVVSAAAIGLLVLLDSMKTALHETKKQPYTREAIDAKLALNPELLSAAGKLPSTGARYATTDEAFAAISQYSADDDKLRTQTAEIIGRYAPALTAADQNITALLALTDRPKTFRDDLATQVALRSTLTSARTAELNDAQHSASLARARLKWSWDNIDFSSAKSKYEYFRNPQISAVAARIVDADDPLNVIYDSLWYGALIIGVLTFAALLLSPIFHAVPISGAEESLAEKVKSLIARSPRAMRTASSVAATAVGAMAIVGAAAALPSSPLRDPAPEPDRVYAEPVNTRTPPQTETTETSAPTTTTGDSLESLREDLTHLQEAVAGHDGSDSSHAVLIAAINARAIDPDTLAMRVGAQFDEKLLTFDRTLAKRDADMNTKLDRTHEVITKELAPAIQHTGWLVDSIDKDVKSVDRNVQAAGSSITTRADTIETVAFLPQQLGERPSTVAAFLGFDRYRVTAASDLVLEKIGAPQEVKDVVSSLGSSALSGDDIRVALRRNVCPTSNRNCKTYRTWINPVLRATRIN
jgi:hypothetical protein